MSKKALENKKAVKTVVNEATAPKGKIKGLKVINNSTSVKKAEAEAENKDCLLLKGATFNSFGDLCRQYYKGEADGTFKEFEALKMVEKKSAICKAGKTLFMSAQFNLASAVNHNVDSDTKALAGNELTEFIKNVFRLVGEAPAKKDQSDKRAPFRVDSKSIVGIKMVLATITNDLYEKAMAKGEALSDLEYYHIVLTFCGIFIAGDYEKFMNGADFAKLEKQARKNVAKKAKATKKDKAEEAEADEAKGADEAENNEPEVNKAPKKKYVSLAYLAMEVLKDWSAEQIEAMLEKAEADGAVIEA